MNTLKKIGNVWQKMKFIRATLFTALAIGSVLSPAWSDYIAIQTPTGMGQALLASTTAQWMGSVSVNPFFAGTYNVNITGPNPAYNAPLTNLQLLQEIDNFGAYVATVDSYTYVAGWADAESYQQFRDTEMAGDFITLCSSPTAFVLGQMSTTTFDMATCQATLATISQAIYQQQLSTPTVVPGDFQ